MIKIQKRVIMQDVFGIFFFVTPYRMTYTNRQGIDCTGADTVLRAVADNPDRFRRNVRRFDKSPEGLQRVFGIGFVVQGLVTADHPVKNIRTKQKRQFKFKQAAVLIRHYRQADMAAFQPGQNLMRAGKG